MMFITGSVLIVSVAHLFIEHVCPHQREPRINVYGFVSIMNKVWVIIS